MNDDLSLLASAYLDDEVTPDERALVDADPALVAEVERLRSVRALLADVEPQAISTREEQLAAALSAWDRLPDAERTAVLRDATPPGADAAAVVGAASVIAPSRLPSRRRSTTPRWLGLAAAALVVVFAGGVALQFASGGGDDSDDSSSADAFLADEPSELAAGGSPTDEEMLASREAADVAADADALPDTTIDTGIDDAAPPPEGSVVVLMTTDDLALFASDAVDAPTSPVGPVATSAPTGESPATLPTCFSVDVIVGAAIFVDQPVIVGIDEARDLAIAYEVERCVEVARARLP